MFNLDLGEAAVEETTLTERSMTVTKADSDIETIEFLDLQLLQHFQNKIQIQPSLTRQHVSFQANKSRSGYRWYKYKEAFSAALVEYLLHHYGILSGRILDPFAGSGTTLFVASSIGLDADGIELLPIGQEIIGTRLCLDKKFTVDDIAVLQKWIKQCPWESSELRQPIIQLRITRGAYPEETLFSIEQYLGAMQLENEQVQVVLRFALLCVLESISYTRKDGQYLRWDYRSGRQQGGSSFNKGVILSFKQAICEKLSEILLDLKVVDQQKNLFLKQVKSGEINLIYGSSLQVMPTLKSEIYDAVITSPPYCNRYDYTRTYALELALLGVEEQELVNFRQQMLSCTVENRAKDLLGISSRWADAVSATDQQELLQAVLKYLERQREQGKLNNKGISRMVRGYFYEMACIMAECNRVMKPNARLFMVNDNVRYAGVSISVDLILARIAQQIGFEVESILVLPQGKGNSSQQMGKHGRDCLRKCIYVWRKINSAEVEMVSEHPLTVQPDLLAGIFKTTPISLSSDQTVTEQHSEKNIAPYLRHLSSSESLVTPYERVRAGFVALALERNRRATPFVDQARVLKADASKVATPSQLLNLPEIRKALLTAAGVSDKAAKHMEEQDITDAIGGLIREFLEPAGPDFVEELVYRFLLTRGDTLGGTMRNIGGELASRKFTRTLLAILTLAGIPYHWYHKTAKTWIPMTENDAGIELDFRGLSWSSGEKNRTLFYNLTVPLLKKNVDVCLLDCSYREFLPITTGNPNFYLALGELKGGIDPAGADEHWKTANSALARIRKGFLAQGLSPSTFFLGAAIATSMAEEIWSQLEDGGLSNAANATDEMQTDSLCQWLCNL